jgi:uncharacterized membrane protein YfcA
MTILQAVLLFFAAAIAGALNSVAGGGSFISFPALLSVSSLAKLSNTTNTVALWPGSAASVGAYRDEFTHQQPGFYGLVVVSLIGGAVGGVLLIVTPEATFGALLPWLLLFATLLFAFGRNISMALRSRLAHVDMPSYVLNITVFVAQFIISIYGGFFGGGIGIMMLAMLSVWGMENIHKMNAIKTLLATCINGMAVALFVYFQQVLWAEAALMIVGAILGGYLGAYYARKIDPQLIRRFVLVVASLITVIFFVRTYFPVVR